MLLQSQDEELGRIYAQMDSLTSLYDEDGNKKIGHDLNVAEKNFVLIKLIFVKLKKCSMISKLKKV